MPLSIVVRLREGRYEAGGLRADTAEWPPHPGRLFCALVASASREEHWRALRWLEAAGAPEVWASAQYTTARRDTYVVTNATDGKASSQHRLGRTNGMRTRVSAEPADARFAVVWPAAAPSPQTLEMLRVLARGVPYLGRSTSPVTLQVSDEAPAAREQWTRFAPAQPGEATAVMLRVPYGGYTDRLQAAYRDGRRAWEESHALAYAVPCSAPVPSAEGAASPFSELLVFPLQQGTVKPEGELLLALTTKLRAAVLSRVRTDVPAQISGHGADDRRHLAYLALPNAGYEHSDGRLLGVALAVPGDLPAEDYARLWDAVVADPLDHLRLTAEHKVRLEHPLSSPTAWGLKPERWTAAERPGARVWITATPVMLDRFPGRGSGDEGIARELRRSITKAGYPEPQAVEFFPAPMLPGGLHRPLRASVPAKRFGKPMVHAQVTFPQPVCGPVLVGAMRYLGLGLFAPLGEAT